MPIISCMKWVHSTAKVPAWPGVTVTSADWPLASSTTPFFTLAWSSGCDLRGGKKSGRAEIMIFGAAIDEMYLIGGSRLQIERAGRKGIIGQGNGDRGGGLRPCAARWASKTRAMANLIMGISMDASSQCNSRSAGMEARWRLCSVSVTETEDAPQYSRKTAKNVA